MKTSVSKRKTKERLIFTELKYFICRVHGYLDTNAFSISENIAQLLTPLRKKTEVETE